MKKIFLFVLVTILACAGALYAQEEDKMTVVGLGVSISQSPYDGADTKVWPVPIIKWSNDHFFIDGKEAGVSVLKNNDMRASFILTPHLEGFKDEDALILNGMEDRHYSLDGGGQLVWHIPYSKDFDLTINGVTDLLNEHKGQEISAALSKTFKLETSHLVPNVGIRWKSKKVVSYYYGVRASEVAVDRPEYTPDATVNVFGYLDYYQGLPKDWVLVTRIGIEALGNEIQDSPLVNKSVIVNGIIGLAKKF